jgi:hypothetical protein
MAKPLLSAEDLFALHGTAFNMAENMHKAKNLSSLMNSQRRGLWLVLLYVHNILFHHTIAVFCTASSNLQTGRIYM